MGDHVVSAEELEVMLEDLSSKNDPLEGLLGPKSVTWKIWGESVSLFSLPTAILMELAHPVLGEALSEHSAFFDDPRGRFHRTLS
jgi:uncharacterized protein (DUF2236 family)